MTPQQCLGPFTFPGLQGAQGLGMDGMHGSSAAADDRCILRCSKGPVATSRPHGDHSSPLHPINLLTISQPITA
jgi:hypothetical protein